MIPSFCQRQMFHGLRFGLLLLATASVGYPTVVQGQESLERAIQAVSGASTESLDAAERAVRANNATPQQKILARQAQIVRQNNDAINRRATIGELDNPTYQKLQSDFDRFNSNIAEEAAASAGLKYGKQVSPPKPFAPGTDSDYIFSSADPNKPVTPEQIKQAKDTYNQRLNDEFGTRGVDYAKKLDTDLMANAKGVSPNNFERIGHLNNDPYFRTGAADYEAKKRAIAKRKQEIAEYDEKQRKGTLEPGAQDPRKQPAPPEISPRESKAYADEMIEMAGKKSDKIDHLRDDAVAARKADPTRANWTDKPLSEKLRAIDDPNRSREVKDLDAELTTKQQKQAKYIDRLNEETQRIFDETVKPRVNGATPPEHSDITKTAADRSTDPNDPKKQAQRPNQTLTEKDVAALNRRNAATANALEDHLLAQAVRNNAEVRAGAASTESRRVGPPEAPSPRQQNFADAAELASRLSPSQQAELLDDVRRKYGNSAADELTAELRRLNTRGDGVFDSIMKRLGGPTGTIDKAGKGMLAVDILNGGQTILDVLDGKKTLAEGAEEIGDQVTGGMISLYRKTEDLGRALVAVEKEQLAYDEEWLIETTDRLRDAGVDKADRLAIMTAQRQGDSSVLESTLKGLAEQGKEVTLPERHIAQVEGDESFWDRLFAVPAGIVQSIGRAGGFAINTGSNLLQLPKLFYDLNRDDALANLSEEEARASIERMADQIRELYRDPDSRKLFPESFTEDEVVYFLKANLDLGRKPLDGLVDPAKLQGPAPTTTVPSVIGYPLPAAMELLQGQLLTAQLIKGKEAPDEKRESQVYFQDPEAGSVVALQAEVQVMYYGPAKKEPVIVPNLVGLPKAEAEAKLAELKLTPKPTAGEARPPRTAKRQQVFKQSPAAKTEIFAGQAVHFEYYAGIPVGRYVGLTKDEAIKKIKADELTPKIGEGDQMSENPAERLNIYIQTPQPGEYVWFDEPVEAFYYKISRGFQDGDGKLVDGRFAEAAVTDGQLPGTNIPSAGERTFISYNSPRNVGGKETQTTLGWQIRKYTDAAGAKQMYDMMTKPLASAQSVAPYLRVQKNIGATTATVSMDLKTDRNQASTQMNFQIYRDVFFISYGRIEPVSGRDFSKEAATIMTNSVKLIDMRFPPE